MSESARSTTTSTEVLYRLDNGLKLKLVGTGFSFDASGDAVGGTITSIQVLLNNGTTLVQTISGLNVSLELFQDAAAAFDNAKLENWLMSGADTINGSAGDDHISGRGGNDILNGQGGDDTITGGEGDDTYDGGAGFDTLSFQDAYNDSNAFHGINLNAATGTVTDQFGFSETFQNFEQYRGTQFADTMVGSSSDDTFLGFGGEIQSTAAPVWTPFDMTEMSNRAQPKASPSFLHPVTSLTALGLRTFSPASRMSVPPISRIMSKVIQARTSSEHLPAPTLYMEQPVLT